MIAEARCSEKNILINILMNKLYVTKSDFSKNLLSQKRIFKSELGRNLIDFTDIDLADFEQIFDYIISNCIQEKMPEPYEFMKKYFEKRNKVALKNPYYCIYTNSFAANAMMSREFPDIAIDNGMRLLNLDDSYKIDGMQQTEVLQKLKEIYLEGIYQKRIMIFSEISAITEYKKQYPKMSLMKILYAMDRLRLFMGEKPFYINRCQNICLAPNIPLDDDMTSSEALTILARENVRIYKTEQFKTSDEMIIFDLINLANRDILIKICENCNRLFIVTGRSDTKYCRRIMTNEKKPCTVLGAQKAFKENYFNNTFKQMVDKYRSKYKNQMACGKIDDEDYKLWSKLAREKYLACRNLDENSKQRQDFIAWLKLDFYDAIGAPYKSISEKYETI